MSVVLLSGGMDSTICLYWLFRERPSETPVGVFVDYGQRHGPAEYRAAQRIASDAGVTLESWDVGRIFGKVGDVFPHRNVVLLSIAAARAAFHGFSRVVVGACAEDAAGFPDCRPSFLSAMEDTIRASGDPAFGIDAPLLHLSKRASLDLADELGCMEAVARSWSCYQPKYRGARAPATCGACAACLKREAAFR